MTKEGIKTAISDVDKKIAELKGKHPNQEMCPWLCNDHPVAMEHWQLVQTRIGLKRSRIPDFTVEQREARASRMRENHAARRILYTQSADKTPSDPEVPKIANVVLSIGI